MPSFGSTKAICTYQNNDASEFKITGYWAQISSTGIRGSLGRKWNKINWFDYLSKHMFNFKRMAIMSP